MRTERPGALSPYTKYKKHLRIEFARKCVYCRMPDSFSRAGFGADHYLPKSSHPHLLEAYDNLYYCCPGCNSRKGSRWCIEGKEQSHFIPNPCDHVMFAHLRFVDEKVEARTEAGKFALAALGLNDPDVVQHRAAIMRNADLAASKMREIERDIDEVLNRERRGEMAAADALQALHTLYNAREQVENMMDVLYGLKIPEPDD